MRAATSAAAAAQVACRRHHKPARESPALNSCLLQAMARHPKLKKLARERGLSAAYLKRRCKQVVPEWKIAALPIKKAFTIDQMRARLAYAVEAVKRPMDYWRSTVFYDEHVMYRRPKALPGIFLAGRRRRLCGDKRLRRNPWQHPKLHFAYGVHWKLGVLGPYWISDCTGWKRAKKYKVCSATHLPPVRLLLLPVHAQLERCAGVGGGVEDEGCHLLLLCIVLSCC